MRTTIKTIGLGLLMMHSTCGMLNAQTFCNPLNLEYRFTFGGDSYREAADPMVIIYEDDYYIFASKSGGYWWSNDFRDWHFVASKGIDIERYAPAVWEYDGKLYYTSSEEGDIYVADDVKGGVWHKVCDHPVEWNDPWVFVDDDKRVYAYWGCSENGDIQCAELDPNNDYRPLTPTMVAICSMQDHNGYERAGENNEEGAPWTEGAAMLKYKGKYYLTYATPGTQFRTYCDGYYVSDSPLGPFTLGKNSPATRRASGFVTGTGHGGLFFDKAGQLWAIESMTISLKHMFERRLALMPAYIDDDGLLHTETAFADMPQHYPAASADDKRVRDDRSEVNTSFLPLVNMKSKNRAKASSSLEGHAPSLAFDEDIRTYWSASSGNVGEWLQIDLGRICNVRGVQVNFYESETTFNMGRARQFVTKYTIEQSVDGKHWLMLVDRSNQTKDYTHDYIELPNNTMARYLRVTNCGDIPGGGLFALSDLRVFGSSVGVAPLQVKKCSVERDEADSRHAVIRWKAVTNADGYIVRYGISPDRLWSSYQVWGKNNCTLDMRALVKGTPYYYRIDTFNGNGVSEGYIIMCDTETN